ncbi:hypothetical protein CC79DRAFT_1363492 [Sarocladium strictum]
MRVTLPLALLVASVSAAGTCTKDACATAVAKPACKDKKWSPAHESDCSSFLRYTSIPGATIVYETAQQSTITLRETTTPGPETDEATATPLDETDTASVTSDPMTVFVTVTPTDTATVTIRKFNWTPTWCATWKAKWTQTTTATQTNVNTVTETVYFSNPQRRAIAARSTEDVLRPTDIPRYAALCGGAEQYRSACACMGVQTTTIESVGSTITETIEPNAETVIAIDTVTQPAVTITTTLPAQTQTVTVTLPGPLITESTTVEATTISTSTTIDPDTVTVTQQDTQVSTTTSVSTKTRSVGPICTVYTPSSTSCNCKFEILCNTAVSVDLSTFFRKIDFNVYVGSIEECMSRCFNNPSCQFGDFASLSNGGLCSSYSGNPGDSGTTSQSGSRYFEKDGNVNCSNC